MKGKARIFSVASGLRYDAPENRKNTIFVFLALFELVAVILLFGLFDRIVEWLYSVPFIAGLLNGASNTLGSQVSYILLTVKVIILNLVAIYLFVFLKSFIKKFIIDFPEKVKTHGLRVALFGKKKKKNKKAAEGEEEKPEEPKKKRRRIPFFDHTKLSDIKDDKKDDDGAVEKKPEKKERGILAKWFLSLFFDGDDFEYARGWVVRTRSVLNIFIWLVLAVYVVFFATMLTSVLFPLSDELYEFLLNIVRIGDWFMYPFLSLLLLRELCNVFDVPLVEKKTAAEKAEDETKLDVIKRDAKIRKLLAELKRRFDTEHYLRYYPEVESDEVPEYVTTSVMYKSALDYIRNMMQESSGHVVESYMEHLDAVYNDEHTYFAASFYSEIGEYLIAYTYIRLLSGARQVFVVSDPAEKETLRAYISDRLMKMTGSSAVATWRVYTADECLEQADILIVTPEDFVHNDIAERHPAFFEEVCNAIFIDADKLISLDSYLCPVMATRLQNATDGKIRFIFLSLNLLKGFAAGSLPRFFCVDKVSSFSSAKENESSSCVLWNRESKKHRIYNKRGQKNTGLEAIIAEQACLYGVDGVRLITDAALEHADKNVLARHNVEINNFYKDIVDVNYMIYSDDKCNLSAALYACMRFRGRKKSVVHIISKPYLLREYFASKAITEDHITRSSFIQPRVTEHFERHKLSLLRIFCDATFDTGIPVYDFEERVREVMRAAKERNDIVSSAYCRCMLKSRSIDSLKLGELAAYLVAGICDNDPATDGSDKLCLENSAAGKAKNFYIIVDSPKNNGFSNYTEKCIIFNKVKYVFGKLIEWNRRVELRLNDAVIGRLDTFPTRVHLEYVEGQSLIYNNSEYEIDHISEDGRAIYLRQENTSIKNCLDTVILRHYKLGEVTPIGESAVLDNSRSILEQIRVTRMLAKMDATTFGFYSLTSDRQTLDFYRGVEGNLNYDNPKVRSYADARVLRVELKSREECTDGMRRLLAAVFNEFAKTLFPGAYRCVAIVPVLSEPFELGENCKDGDPLLRVKTLYPFLNAPTEEFVETDSHRIQLYIINDCAEDVGILDWFYDHSARYMQEFLANIYSYLHWQKLRPELSHYIYFGGTELPECYDLDGCCELLGDLNLILSDSGEKDFETAGEDIVEDKIEYCSFCHKPMESGRYTFFDDHRLICSECFDIVTERDRLESIYKAVLDYLGDTYPEIILSNPKVDFDEVYELTAEQLLSENYYRVDFANKTIFVEIDNPANNVFVSILRGLITFWQVDNSLAHHYSEAQLYYEEMEYLRSIGESVSAEWVYNNVPEHVRSFIDEIVAYIKGESAEEVDEDADGEDGEDESKPEPTPTPDGDRTSFGFMRAKQDEISSDDWDGEEPEDEDYSDNLYDPNKIPRFWKRYLRGEHIDDGKEEDVSDAETDGDDDTFFDKNDSDGEASDDEVLVEDDSSPNSPPPIEDGEADEEPSDASEDAEEPAVDEKARKRLEKQRQKEEKKRQREEKRRQKQLEWEKKMDALDEEENKRRMMNGEDPIDYGNKKKSDDSADGGDTVEEKPKKKSLFDRFKKKPKDEVKDDATDEDKTSDSSEDDSTDGKKTDGKSSDKKTDDLTDDLTDEDSSDDAEDDTADDTPAGDDSEEDKELDRKPSKKKKKKERRGGLFAKRSLGEKILPHEDDEKKNPKIRLYNDLVRSAYNLSEEPVSREGVSDDELSRIFLYVKNDYPELFWLGGYAYTSTTVAHKFRCRDANGRLDVKQIKTKKQEMIKAAQHFTKGITRRTNPYKAVLTIYRRLILTLDYDGIGLNGRIDQDMSRDDALRSLYNALVHHKVVCAGYAVAMQYLLQSVGIVCGYVVSESIRDGSCHAFNVLKIGKYCYYLDATWGDYSNTLHGGDKDTVHYDYFCTPYSEFTRTPEGQEPLHVPRKEFYPEFESFKYTNHEYYRFHKAYLTSYSEAEIARIISDAALRYKKEEMGCFIAGMRCSTPQFLNYVISVLMTKDTLSSVMSKAKDMTLKKNKKAAKLLDRPFAVYPHKTSGVLEFVFEEPETKKGKSKKK